MEVRLNVDDDFLRNIQDTIGGPVKATDVLRDALTLLNWAVAEAANGRVVLSATNTGENLHRLVMPTLSKIEVRARQSIEA